VRAATRPKDAEQTAVRVDSGHITLATLREAPDASKLRDAAGRIVIDML
jgi:hypothetical protein